MLDLQHLLQVGNFDPVTVAQLSDALGFGIESATQTGSTLNPSVFSSELTVVGTMAFALAAPTAAGQRKRITCVAASSTPLGTVTISSPDQTAGLVCPSTFTFTAAGQEVSLTATAALAWRVTAVKRAGTQTLVVGTTLTAGLQLAALYALSVTGTVSSTTTRALPNGNLPGDQVQIGCSVAASTPVGNINFAGLSSANAALTNIGAVSATTMIANLLWNGTAWLVVSSSNTTIS